MVENNNGNYLSAGEMPLPTLHVMFALGYGLLALMWFTIVQRAT